MNKKILSVLIGVIVVLFLFGCAEEKASIPETTAPPATEEVEKVKESASISPEEEPVTQEISTTMDGSTTGDATIINFPQKDLALYFGVWLATPYFSGTQSLEKREDLVALGANTVAFAVEIPYYRDGSIDEEAMEDSKKEARRLLRYYKEAGLAVALSPEPLLIEFEGEPQPLPANIRERFVQEYTPHAIDLAKIAEEENAEIFSPMNEPDYKLGYELASSWGQDILPQVRQVFTGKVMWKGLTSDDHENIKKVDFSGYDIIGFTSFPWGGITNYKSNFRLFLTALQEKAAQDGVKELFAAEFGTYEPVRLSKQDEAKSIQYVFEEGKGKLQGFLVFDTPEGFGTPIKGSELENVVKEEFGKLK